MRIIPNRRKPVGMLFSALFSAVCTGSVLAQTARLEEVIVTAEKRSTTLQDTAIAVTALSGDDLAQGLINNALDIQMSVPNMLMSKGQFNAANIAIRGIGNSAVGVSADSGTGVHFNGVYLNAPRSFETEYYDIERVEILRGPQGTLYGRNTTAGVINIISRRPEPEFGGDIQIELGNYNAVKTRGAINLPLNDSWQQRFSGFFLRRDGFVDNTFTGEDVDGRDMYSLRSSTLFSNERVEAHLVVNYFKEDSDRMRGSNQRCLRDPEGILGCLPTGLADQRTHTGATVTGFITNLIGSVTGLSFPEDDFVNSAIYANPRRQALDFTPVYEVEEWVSSLEINLELGDYTLTSLTGYHDAFFDARNDYDFAVASEPWPVEVRVQQGPDGYYTTDRAYSSDRSFIDSRQWSQELRLASDFQGDWNFLLGAFWLNYDAHNDYYVYNAALELFGQLNGLPDVQRQFWSNTDPYELDTWAVFGELYWQATARLSVTLGLRYTEEEKTSRQRTIYLAFLDDPTLPGGDYETYQGDSDEVTGKLNLSYDFGDDVLLYATLSRSYKSGGFNPISVESPLLDPARGGNPDLAFFGPEYINALELGLKTRWLDNRLQLNGTWFYYDFQDLQVAKITNQTSINENVDSSSVQGLETELIWVPDSHWRLGANIAWLDTEIDEFVSVDPANINQLGTTENIVSGPNANTYVGPGCPGGTRTCDGLPYDLSGNQLVNAPEYSVSLSVEYTWPLDNNLDLRLGSSYYWQDNFYTRLFNAPNDRVDQWDVWNATLGIHRQDGRWYLQGWVRNIGDEDHVTGQWLADQNLGLITNQFLLEPRTYGLTLGYSF